MPVQPEVVPLQYRKVPPARMLQQFCAVPARPQVFFAQSREDDIRVAGGILPDNLRGPVLRGVVPHKNLVPKLGLLRQNTI